MLITFKMLQSVMPVTLPWEIIKSHLQTLQNALSAHCDHFETTPLKSKNYCFLLIFFFFFKYGHGSTAMM